MTKVFWRFVYIYIYIFFIITRATTRLKGIRFEFGEISLIYNVTLVSYFSINAKRYVLYIFFICPATVQKKKKLKLNSRIYQ